MHLKRLNSCYLIVAISVMLVHAHASHGWQGGGGGGVVEGERLGLHALLICKLQIHCRSKSKPHIL